MNAVTEERRRDTRPLTRRPFWLLIPGGLLTAIVIVVPLALAVYIALIDLDQYSLRRWLAAPFVGIANLVEATTETGLLRSIWISASSSVLIAVITLPIGVAAALAVHNAMRGRALIRSLFLIPYVLPAFVTATVWRTLLQPSGAVNSGLDLFGITGGSWLTGERTYWTMVLVTVWYSWPFVYLLVLAALQGIEREANEASAIDGADRWQKLRFILLPQIKGAVALAFVLGVLNHLNQFTIPYVMFGSPAPDPVEVLPMLTYSTSFETFRFGLGSAMAVVSLLIVLVPLVIYLRAARLDAGEES
jgi:multiple sugar transport system permease protein